MPFDSSLWKPLSAKTKIILKWMKCVSREKRYFKYISSTKVYISTVEMYYSSVEMYYSYLADMAAAT